MDILFWLLGVTGGLLFVVGLFTYILCPPSDEPNPSYEAKRKRAIRYAVLSMDMGIFLMLIAGFLRFS